MIRYFINYTISVNFIITLTAIQVSAQNSTRFDVVINELLADPAPGVGLPNSEFVELKNVSSSPVNLRNWKISDGSTTATISGNFMLDPDSVVIICPASSIASFAVFGKALGVSGFPSLNNDADIISLISPEQKIIHAVGYSEKWFDNSVKGEGGWSLEMIDAQNPCGGPSNWKPSQDPRGGTPGQKNSIEAFNPDRIPPALIRTYPADSFTVVAVFDELVDSSHAATAKFHINNNVGFSVQATPIPPLFNEVKLTFNSSLALETTYELKITGISDCAGNMIGTFNTAKAGRISRCDSLDLVINEILFNPVTDGSDYVELYNRSNKIVDASRLYIASRNGSGAISSTKRISETPFLIFPGDHLTITEEPSLIKRQFLVANPEMLLTVSGLPSFPDDEGDVIIMNELGKIVDDLSYKDEWHFALVDNKNGVALERIDPHKNTGDPGNWTSAASTAGFGTPTSKNSQFKNPNTGALQVSISSRIFSPDNDGIDDMCFINFQFASPGFVARVMVFDINGRMVRKLAANQNLGQSGFFRWDGMNDLGGQCPAGLYIILTEIFDLNGNSKKFKNPVALARKF